MAREDPAATCLLVTAGGEVKPLLTREENELLRSEFADGATELEGRYVLKKVLGQGAMGVVYLARDRRLARYVAVKILPRKIARDRRLADRFRRESQMLAQLSHGNLIAAFDAGEVRGYPYFVMEYVEGINVADLLDVRKVFEEPESLRIVLQVAEALDYAHQKDLIHRDIKPANIMLTRDGTAKLGDLGLALMTVNREWIEGDEGVVGTPYYMSPEQVSGREDLDIRTDVYSLGATLYHMVTGTAPFQGKTPWEVMRKHVSEPLVPPDHLDDRLTVGLGEMVETMMAKDREERYANPQDLVFDIKRLLAGEAPLIAGQGIKSAALELLAEGIHSANPPPNARTTGTLEKRIHRAHRVIVLLLVLLGFAIVANLLLLSWLLEASPNG